MPDSNILPSTPATSQILLVEDDLCLGESIIESLAQDCLQVTHVAHGNEVFQQLSQHRFDLILLDLQLPGYDGFEILERLRTLPSSDRVPVIVTSAEQGIAVKLRCFELGAVDYISKPYDSLELRVRAHAQIHAKLKQDILVEKIRELESARTAAEHSSKTKAGFLANMSHEIRTPMNGVIAMTGLLMQTQLDEEQTDFVETIRTSGESLLSIINDILNYSKIESGKMELEREPFKLRPCIEATLDMLSSKAAEKHLELLYRIDPDVPSEVMGDVTRLRQILVNLVGNAIKFTHQGTVCIDVKAAKLTDPELLEFTRRTAEDSKADWQFHFSVSDTGVGIPPDKLPLLFQDFIQADSSISRNYGGTGLGLAISKGLVELMGGRMWVESEEGRGSVFQFLIPLAAAGTADTTFTKNTVASLRGLQALILMENELSSRVLEEQLGRWGLKTRCFSDAKKMLNSFQAGDPVDVILLDEENRGAKGTELAKTIHTMPGGQNLPILLFSHLGKRSEASDLLSPETTVCLNKPVKPEPLQEGLLQVISRHRKPAESRARPDTKPANRDTLAERFPLSILLTDDNIINLKVASRLLRQLGYEPDLAKTGLEAISALEKKPYDIVLMDVQMPEMNGLEATRHIRTQQQAPDGHPHFQRRIAIVAMTANAMQGDREKCLSAGMDDYIPKPVRAELLEETLIRLATDIHEGRNGEDQVRSEKHSNDAEGDDGAGAIPPTAALGSHAEPVDVDRLTEFAGGGPESIDELIELYIRQTEEQLHNLQDVLAARTPSEVARIAHSCAGASATCGMIALVPLLRRLEHLGQENDLQAAPELMNQILSEYHRTKKFLEDRFSFGSSDVPKTIAL